jgi:antibiotic biosynthesis monooxygenase (ABM) superfamily enzyme
MDEQARQASVLSESSSVTEAAQAEGAVDRGAATVVLGQQVKPGYWDEYQRWQNDVNASAARFAGFLGTQVTPPADDHGEWTIIYRFDSVQRLYEWLNSPARTELLERGTALFASPGSQQVMAGDSAEALVTVVVSHPVSPEYEKEFLDWQRRINGAAAKFPGFRGAELFRPVPGVQEEWTVVYRFASPKDLDRWLDSDVEKELIREADHFRASTTRKFDSSFGSWFSFGRAGAAEAAPPDWKTALSVLVALYPTVVVLSLIITRLWYAPFWKVLLLGNILSVSLLTWVVMPVVTRALRFWLTPAPDAPQPRTDVLGVVACAAFLIGIAGVFWLVTRVVWYLP